MILLRLRIIFLKNFVFTYICNFNIDVKLFIYATLFSQIYVSSHSFAHLHILIYLRLYENN